MQSRRKIIIITLALVLSLLLLGAVTLLVLGFVQYFDVESALKDSTRTLKQLYARNPFPSQDNLKVERENIRTIKQELESLQTALGTGQVEPVGQSPAKFITQFWETQKHLSTPGGGAIKVDKKFDFGFGRYMGGVLPAPQDVPRLTQQLKIEESLCNILYAGGITALTGVSRQEFEVDAVGAPVGRQAMGMKNNVDPNAGMIPAGMLYGRWRFGFQFSCREGALMNVLNSLANCPIFVVVTGLEIKGDEALFSRKESDAAKVASNPDSLAVAKDEVKTRDYRVVCGREGLLNVIMELDVYQFAKPQTVESGKKPGGAQ